MMNDARMNGFPPFTATQWQELEHQALIFKYMVSGLPIPSDLLFTVKRSLDSSLSSKLLLQHQPPPPHHRQHIGWNSIQMGFGRKIDPEPGRCRRTDGKKWRCSKEAHPDSKYCERHMHRGRNRSRKPVEIMTPATASSSSIGPPLPPSSSSSSSSSPSSLTPISSLSHHHHNQQPSLTFSSSSFPSDSLHHHHHHSTHPYYTASHGHDHYPYSHSSFPKHPVACFSSYNPDDDNNSSSATQLILDHGPYSHANKDYRKSYGNGMKEGFDQEYLGAARMTLRGGSPPVMDESWKLAPLTMGSSLANVKERSCSGLETGINCLKLLHQGQGFSEASSKQQNQELDHHHHQHQSHFNLLGSDVKSEMSFEIVRGDAAAAAGEDDDGGSVCKNLKVMHHFFDELPHSQRSKESWLDPEGKDLLSISIPAPAHDFFMAHKDK